MLAGACESRASSRSKAVSAALLVALVCATMVDAQPLKPERQRQSLSQRAIAEWQEALSEVDELLLDGKPRAAFKRAGRLLEDMTDRMISGGKIGAYLGSALALRAVAAVQMGEREEGRWHWQVAIQLFPTIAAHDLTAYGEAGAYLKTIEAPRERKGGEEVDIDPEKLVAPKKRRSPTP